MSDSSAFPVDVPRSTTLRELERLERKVFRNSYLFLGISLLYVAWCGLNGIGLGGSRVPYEDRHWLMADATWLKGGVFLICFILARCRPHAIGFGIGGLFIVAWLVGAVWTSWDAATAGVGSFVIGFLLLSGLFAYLTARKYDRALREQTALAIDVSI